MLDFGIAKRMAVMGSPVQTATIAPTGWVAGTAAYMSPEQARAEELDGRTDVFSFGIVLCEMFTGRHPFERSTPADTLAAIIGPSRASIRSAILAARSSSGSFASVSSGTRRCVTIGARTADRSSEAESDSHAGCRRWSSTVASVSHPCRGRGRARSDGGGYRAVSPVGRTDVSIGRRPPVRQRRSWFGLRLSGGRDHGQHHYPIIAGAGSSGDLARGCLQLSGARRRSPHRRERAGRRGVGDRPCASQRRFGHHQRRDRGRARQLPFLGGDRTRRRPTELVVAQDEIPRAVSDRLRPAFKTADHAAVNVRTGSEAYQQYPARPIFLASVDAGRRPPRRRLVPEGDRSRR